MKIRKLALRRDLGIELTTFELNSIAGGATPSCPTWCVSCADKCPSVPLRDCTVLNVTRDDTCIC